MLPPIIQSTEIASSSPRTVPMTNSSNPYRRPESVSANASTIRVSNPISTVRINDDRRQQLGQQITSNQSYLALSVPTVSSTTSSVINPSTQATILHPQNLDGMQIATTSIRAQTIHPTQVNSTILPSLLASTPSLTHTATTEKAMKIGIDYQQLRDLLVRAVQCESIYNQIYGKVYTVQNVVQVGTKLYFNIEKNRKGKQSKKDDITNKSVKTDKVRR
jgi:hypothetical protein